MQTLLFASLILSTLCVAGAAFHVLADAQGRHQRRVKKRLGRLAGAISYQPEESLLKTPVGTLPRLDQWLEQRAGLSSLKTLLLQANISWHLASFLMLLFLGGTMGLALGFLRWKVPGAFGGCLLGVVLPYQFLVFKKKQRLKKFEKQLPDALELLSRGLKAGHAFTSGLQLVAEEMADPMGGEFFTTFKEYNHGLDLNSALLNLCRRVDLRDLKFFTTAVMIQRETGGNLSEILDKIARLIRERFKLRNQIQALTAEGRLSGVILVLLPPVTALALFYMNPEYILLLVRHPLGRLMSGTALFFQAMGVISIRKIVRIKV